MLKADVIIDRVGSLPAAPSVLAELLEEFRKEDHDLDRIVGLITHDPSIAAQVLKLCNSAEFAADHPVNDVFEAVARVGFYQVYRMVAAVVGAGALAIGKKGSLEMGSYWRHSVLTAVAAETLAARYGEGGGVAFTAALLHDIGKLVLGAAEDAAYLQLRQTVGASGQTVMQAERAQFGTDHAEVGGRLLARWHLPPHLVSAVRYHHSPTSAGESARLAAFVCVGNELAHVISHAVTPPTVSAPEALQAMAGLPLFQSEVAGLVVKINEGCKAAASIMAIAG